MLTGGMKKMKNMKRTAALLLTLCLLAMAMPIAWANDIATDNPNPEQELPLEDVPAEETIGEEDEKFEVILSGSSEEVVEEVEATDILPEEIIISETSNVEPTMAGEGDVSIDAAHFPDANFRDYVKKFDTDKDDMLSAAERESVTEIRVGGEDIECLTGIEQFPKLTDLVCYENQLTSLDVGNCTALTYLQCDDNELTSLNVSNCTALTELHCSSNQLTSLDVSKCPALTDLACSSNQLTSLDVSKCPLNASLMSHLSSLHS